MKKSLMLIAIMSVNLYAQVYSYHHPKHKPKGLYLVTLIESENIYRDYRLYCPTMTIRDISNGKERKAHKVKDVLYSHYDDFYLDIKSICNPKKTQYKKKKRDIKALSIKEMSEDGSTAEILLKDSKNSCNMQVVIGKYVVETNCIKLTNSKNIKIVCTPHKKMCKTEKEIFEFIDTELKSTLDAMREYQARVTQKEIDDRRFIPKIETVIQHKEPETNVQIILDEYTNNGIRADNKYRNKRVEITGIIAEIGRDFEGHLYLSFTSNKIFDLSNILAYFHENMSSELGKLQIKDKITVSCIVQNFQTFSLIMDRCKIIYC